MKPKNNRSAKKTASVRVLKMTQSVEARLRRDLIHYYFEDHSTKWSFAAAQATIDRLTVLVEKNATDAQKLEKVVEDYLVDAKPGKLRAGADARQVAEAVARDFLIELEHEALMAEENETATRS